MISSLSLRTSEPASAPSSRSHAVTQQGLGPLMLDGDEPIYLLTEDDLLIASAPRTKPAAVAVVQKAPPKVRKESRRPPLMAPGGELRSGSVLLGRYLLLQCMDRDERGAKWRAKEREDGTDVLLHVVPAGTNDCEKALQARVRALSVAGVQHPGLERVIDVATTESGATVIVIGALKGVSIRQLLQARGCIDTIEAASLIKQIASALSAAHAAGLRHGGVTPESIVVRRNTRGAVHAALSGLSAPIERSLVSEVDDVRVLCKVLQALVGERGERDNEAMHALIDGGCGEAGWTSMSALEAALDTFTTGESRAQVPEVNQVKPRLSSSPPRLVAPLPSYTPPQEHLLSTLWRARSSLLLGAGTLMALLAIGVTLATVSSRPAKTQQAPQMMHQAAP